MKIALITDQHIGVRGDAEAFHNYFELFYKNTFFPYLEKNDIQHIICLGDLFDRRKYINFVSLKRGREYLFDPMHKYCQRHGGEFHIIVGNHDVSHKNTNEVNSPDLLLTEYDTFRVYEECTEVSFDGLKIAMVPWICSGNFNTSMDFLDNTSAQVLFGHLEIQGFEMYKGSPNDHGFDPSLFKGFDVVCSGHFHHRSTRGNITYLGSPYEMTWSDYNDPRGFHIFNTNTRELTFIENPYRIHHKLYYDDTHGQEDLLLDLDKDKIQNSYVKVYVMNKTSPAFFDRYIALLESSNVLDYQVIEETINMQMIEHNELEQAEDTMTILKSVVDQLDLTVNKDELVKFFSQLYNESLQVE